MDMFFLLTISASFSGLYVLSLPQLELRTLDISSTSVSSTHFGSCQKRNLTVDQVFAIFNFVFIFVVFFLYPETAYRTLEDLDVYFDKSSNHHTIIRIHDKVSKQTKRPQEAIEAEAQRIAATIAADTKLGVEHGHEHVEDVDRAA